VKANTSFFKVTAAPQHATTCTMADEDYWAEVRQKCQPEGTSKQGMSSLFERCRTHRGSRKRFALITPLGKAAKAQEQRLRTFS
jgi:hypothetical protein